MSNESLYTDPIRRRYRENKGVVSTGVRGLNRMPNEKDLGITQKIKTSAGSMNVYKGIVGSNSMEQMILYSWDYIPECDKSTCSISSKCVVYVAKMDNKCGIMKQYIQSIRKIILEEHSQKVSQTQMYRLGMDLIPLYRNLAKMKIEEMAIVSCVETDKAGVKRMHPIYKEIRETIRLIENTWKTVGLDMERPVKEELNEYEQMGAAPGNYDADGNYIEGEDDANEEEGS